jgi:isoamylase
VSVDAPPLFTGTSVGVGPGDPLVLGARPVPGGFTVAVHAVAARVWLVLLDPRDGRVLAELPFRPEHRTGSVYAMTVSGVASERIGYGFRVLPGRPGAPDGRPVSGVLLDPRARGLAGSGPWGSRPRYVCRILPDRLDPVAPGPRIDPADLVIYETHVRGFTRHQSSGAAAPGTYAALADRIPYLRRLGVNCVQLLPIAEFDETDNTYTAPGTGAPLPNYWGYNTVGFFTPKAAYASEPTPERADAEFRDLVDTLHRAGIAVLLDVVFNHTAEGDHRGPTHSFRALDESGYYLLDRHGAPRNLTATGNTVNANHPVTAAFVLDCLRHWVTRYGVDGFRFDMASILNRDGSGTLQAQPWLPTAIARDPVLADSLLIAEATDATGTDQVGSFSADPRWREWNGRYRDDARRLLLARPGSVGRFAARLVGSPDLYPERGPLASVNYIACHDGLTLADWTAYSRRHNAANGEGGGDGIPDEESENGGEEGPSTDPGVLRRRARKHRNALLLLAVSRGIPMLTAGDETARTQHGNNNAYCQDELSWYDWSRTRTEADLLRFTAHCLAFRAAHPVLRRSDHPYSAPDVSWHGEEPDKPDWAVDASLLAVRLHQPDPADTVFVAVNTGDPKTLRLPDPPPGTRWHLHLDTGAEPGADSRAPGDGRALEGDRLHLAAHAAVALAAHP